MAKKNAAATSRQSAASPVEYASAMDKIRDEMAKSKDNYVQVVGEYLTDYLLAHPEAEAALLDKGKSIKGSLETVRKEAEKVKQGNMAVLDDRTVFGIVLGYFGLGCHGDSSVDTPTNAAEVSVGTVLSDTPAPATVSDSTDTATPTAASVSGEPSPSDTVAGIVTPADPFDLDALLGGNLI